MSDAPSRCPCCGAALAAAPPAAAPAPCADCRRRASQRSDSTWYCGGHGPTAGPLSWEDLRRLALRGQLYSTDLIWRPGEAPWLAASALPDLYSPAAGPPPSGDATLPGRPPHGCDSRGTQADRDSPRVLEVCRVSLGEFQVLRSLGIGAMGTVYLARQKEPRRLVALKVLSRQLAGQPGFVNRFRREAALMAGLDHPGLVRFLGLGEDDGLHYFAMEYVDGFTLTRLLERRGGRLGVGDALHITLACAAALDYAHGQHVVHRDVKPTNILVSQLGHIKLTDLGLARPLEEDLSLTESGAVMGTPQYMAPEQGRSARRADARSDVYALGGVLYRMLTGVLPFNGDGTMELLLAKEQGIFPPVRRLNPEVPPRLELIVDKMLARDPRYRYQSCAELSVDLRALGLAREHLSFNPLHVLGPPPGTGTGCVEVLLIHDDPEDVLLAREALAESRIPSRVTVAHDAAEALEILDRTGAAGGRPRPHLIIVGRDLMEHGGLEAVSAIKAREALRCVPLVVLTTSDCAADVLRDHGLEVGLKITGLADLGRLEELLTTPGHCSSVTLVQLASGR